MVKAIFKNLVLAAAGPNEHKIEDLKSWTELRKGRFSLDMDETVTHLLCTNDQFKARLLTRLINFDAVKRAQSKDQRKVHIVHVDWFTFSCTRNKKLRETEYDFKSIRRKELAKIKKQRQEERRAQNTALGETWINPDLYHIFTDKHHFRYEIQLYRTFKNEDGAVHDKYELFLFESHAKPHLYWFGARLFQKKGDGVWRPRGVERTSTTPSTFKPEYNRFKDFFRLKTKYNWYDRVLKAGTGERMHFSYLPPTRGKPVGGNLTKGLNYDECVRQNIELRTLWFELFGDELPDDIQIETVMKDILEDIINRVCVSGEQ
nr:brct domain-containing protein [Colletotrichum truncatum]KAF6781919.1 brct domain-containing protein [Colletotrichum truncatum]